VLLAFPRNPTHIGFFEELREYLLTLAPPIFAFDTA